MTERKLHHGVLVNAGRIQKLQSALREPSRVGLSYSLGVERRVNKAQATETKNYRFKVKLHLMYSGQLS
jgi:hypothetical protein